jgi:hypothetical protein
MSMRIYFYFDEINEHAQLLAHEVKNKFNL